MIDPLICPVCGSIEDTRRVYRSTEGDTVYETYVCEDCGDSSSQYSVEYEAYGKIVESAEGDRVD